MSEEQVETSNFPPSNEQLSQEDRHTLDIAKMNRKLALAAAEKALAENNSAELSYKYVVLQLYMKYGLTEVDAIDEQGFVHRGANQK
jgi:hypothetical protein